MEHLRVKELLDEAAHPECTRERRLKIQDDFLEALKDALCWGKNETVAGRNDGIFYVLNHLFVETAQGNPSAFPGLYPIFAMLCGKRERRGPNLFAKPEWTLMRS